MISVSQVPFLHICVLICRYQELLRLTEGKRLVVVPTFNALSMDAAFQAAEGVPPNGVSCNTTL